jgi:UDP:flavonoid glycosyltransferase YjiC (YdhE family)
MRALFVTWAWPTHFFPLVQLAWAMQAGGHEVRVASQPALTEAITTAGLTAVPVGTDVDIRPITAKFFQWIASQDRPVEWEHLRHKGPSSVKMYVILAEAMVDETIGAARSWRPDIIVHEATSFAGPLAAAVMGVPTVRHIHGVDFTSLSRPYEPEALAPLCERLGLDSVETLGVATVDPCPPSMQITGDIRRLPMSYAPYNGPAILPDWLREPPGRRRLCVTWGTSTSTLTGSRMFMPPQIIAACRDLDVEVVVTLTASDKAALGDVPANVRVVESVPLHLLLGTCDAIVHQGGNGTILTAAWFGLPQLVLPQLPDQLFYCAKLVETGAAAQLRIDEVSDEALRSRLAAVLSEPGYRVAAQRLQAEMLQQPSAAETVAVLEHIAAGRPEPR